MISFMSHNLLYLNYLLFSIYHIYRFLSNYIHFIICYYVDMRYIIIIIKYAVFYGVYTLVIVVHFDNSR